MASPAPIIASFYADPDLPSRVKLDGVVTVVDALNVTWVAGSRGERCGETGGGAMQAAGVGGAAGRPATPCAGCTRPHSAIHRRCRQRPAVGLAPLTLQ